MVDGTVDVTAQKSKRKGKMSMIQFYVQNKIVTIQSYVYILFSALIDSYRQ